MKSRYMRNIIYVNRINYKNITKQKMYMSIIIIYICIYTHPLKKKYIYENKENKTSNKETHSENTIARTRNRQQTEIKKTMTLTRDSNNK